MLYLNFLELVIDVIQRPLTLFSMLDAPNKYGTKCVLKFNWFENSWKGYHDFPREVIFPLSYLIHYINIQKMCKSDIYTENQGPDFG